MRQDRGGRIVNHGFAVSITGQLVIEVRLFIHLGYGKKFSIQNGIQTWVLPIVSQALIQSAKYKLYSLF